MNFINRFPSTSHTRVARLDDDDMAPQMLKAMEEAKGKPEPGPDATEYSLVVDALLTVSDRLQSLEGTMVAVNGGKPQRLKPEKRPTNALIRAMAARSKQKYHSLVAEVKEAQERYAQRK